MSISVTCGACANPFEAPEGDAGGRVRCPACGHELTVPKPAPPEEVLFIPNLPEPRVTGGKAVARLVLATIACFFTVAFLFLPAVRSSREAARRSQCVCNLKQIGLALHNYHETFGCLPPAAITDKAGRPLLSWRVAILPFMEYGPLHQRFHLDEPWDSPHNRSQLGAMPHTFACPSDHDLKPGMTGYVAVIGPKTAFTPDFKPLRFEDFVDGLSETLLIGESRRVVPWTKPEDLPFDMAEPLTGLGSHHNSGFNALLADGYIQFIKGSIAPRTLRALVTRNGIEEDSSDNY